MTELDVVSPDGTRIRAWSNDGEGIPVLLLPGNATTPEGFPSLMRADTGLRVLSYYMRGTFGSERPKDAGRIRVEHHVEDAVAVLDHAGVDRAVIVGWSLGVNSAFEFAMRYPERTLGVLAVGGVPGGTHATLWHPLPLPRRVRSVLAYAVVGLGLVVGPLATRATHLVPGTEATMRLLIRLGLFESSAPPAELAAFLSRVARQDLRWVATLARAGFEHTPMQDLHLIPVPVTFLAGSRDWLTSPRAIAAAAARIPHAVLHTLPATHIIGIEHPDRIVELVHETARRGGWGTPSDSMSADTA